MIKVFVGKKSRVSYGLESTYGTEATPDRWPGIVTRVEDGGNRNDLVTVKGVDSDTLNIDAYLRAVMRRSIDITFLMQHGALLAWVWGQDSVVDNLDGTYTHTLTESNLSSLTIEVAERDSGGDHVERYLGCKPNTFRVEWNAGNPVTHTINVIAQDTTHPDSVTAYNTTNTAFKKYTAYDIAPLQSKQVDVTINGVDLNTTLSGSIELDNGLVAEPVCDSGLGDKIAEPFPTKREFTVNVRGYVSSDVYYDSILSMDTGDRLTGVTEVKISRSATDYVRYTISNPIVESISKPIDVDGERTEFTIVLKPTNVTVEVRDAIGVNYLTGV